jgi:hypothetical protein
MKSASITLAGVLFASCAAGAIDTNLYPMWLHPSKTDEVESNIVAEIKARQMSAGIATNLYAATSWWRSRSGNLATLKTRVKALFDAGDWVMIDELGDTNIMASILASNAVPVYSSANKANALKSWGLPTNYFDYTPWRDLSGVGGFTNDIAAVGHPHGTTNATTAKGGTNYPSGRTKWYTTDYGWDGMAVILPHLRARLGYYDQDEHYLYGDHWNYAGQSSAPWDRTNTMANAIGGAEANYPYGASGFTAAGQVTYLFRNNTNSWFAKTINNGGTGRASANGSTNWISQVRFYLKIGENPMCYDDICEFDGQLDGWTTNRIEVVGYTESNRPMWKLSNTNSPPTNWPPEPSGEGMSSTKGWAIDIYDTGDDVQYILNYIF